MHESFVYWLRAAYRRQEPRIVAMDDAPADALVREMRKLGVRWRRNFRALADRLARHFARSVESRSTAALQRSLREGGFAVEFQRTPGMVDVEKATVAANVALIRSIPEQYLSSVEGIVLRSVQVGRDLSLVTKDLEKRLGVTKRRAALIARDQNNKATAAFDRTRRLEAGITEAIWVHSVAGKEPRPTHVRAGRDHVHYSVAEGWYDPDKRVRRKIQPGELINCRCVSRPVIPGLVET